MLAQAHPLGYELDIPIDPEIAPLMTGLEVPADLTPLRSAGAALPVLFCPVSMEACTCWDEIGISLSLSIKTTN